MASMSRENNALGETSLDHAGRSVQHAHAPQFPDNAAERPVLLDLAEDDVRQDRARSGQLPRTTAAAVSSQLVSIPSTV